MKRILKALGKTLGFLAIGVGIGLTPVVLTNLLGPVPALVVIFGLLASVLFYAIYKAEK
jgi:FtsH-binding integral membrane protein